MQLNLLSSCKGLQLHLNVKWKRFSQLQALDIPSNLCDNLKMEKNCFIVFLCHSQYVYTV